MSSASRGRGRRSKVVAAGAVVIVLAGAGTAWGLSHGSHGGYRTAPAARGTVMQTLSATGTVSPVSHADEVFQVAGTVAHVEVKAGQKVHAGQVLARLDRSDLRAELRSARSTLAAARNRMSDDETGESDASEASSDTGSSQTFEAAQPNVVVDTASPSDSKSYGGPSGGSGGTGLTSLQSAVRAAQQATDESLSESSAALKAANVACSTSTTTTSTSTAATTTTPISAPTTGSTPDPTPSTGSSGDACTAAGAALLSDQQEVDRDEQQLSTAETALTNALDALVGSEGSHSSTGSSGSTGSSRNETGAGSTASAADIALDQATIDQALATVASDEADLAQATLHATISGHVAAVTVAHGDQVTTSATEPAVVVVGSHQEQTTIDLSATDIRHVKVGMTAHVVADGSSRSLTGHVVDVDSAGVESTTGTISYPVTVTLPAGTNVVGGAAAEVTVVVATVDDVVAVPTSAVHYSGTTTYVELLRGGKETRRTVKIGAVGASLTQVTSGLTAGQEVVLADLGAAVPSSSSTVTRVGGFGGGGFGGAGGGGAGFTRRFAVGGGAGATAVGGAAG